MNARARIAVVVSFFVLASAQSILGQGTAFTYQGTLNDNSVPANGTYDFEFLLYDSLQSGNQVGPTVSANGVQVADGSFSVSLDFGSVFFGANRYLEIRVRTGAALSAGPESLGGFTILTPRQPIGTVPYAMKSTDADFAVSASNATTADSAVNSAQLGGVPASDYVVTTDPRMTDARTPTSGSPDYIQNTAKQQVSSNFNISGTGTANLLDSVTGLSVNGVLLIPPSTNFSFFAGPGAGNPNSTGQNNTFIGQSAGTSNTTGFWNVFLGSSAGEANTLGFRNTLIGVNAGRSSVSDRENTFVGYEAGLNNNGGDYNTFVGDRAGVMNTTGEGNTFVGRNAGEDNTVGLLNTFIGIGSGLSNVTGGGNSYVGYLSGASSLDGDFNIMLGYEAGSKTELGNENVFIGYKSGFSSSTGERNTFVGSSSGIFGSGGGSNNTLIGYNTGTSGTLTNATAIGAGASVSTSNTIQLGRQNGSDTVNVSGNLIVGGILTAPVTNTYIQNTTTTQASSNFNISGTGTANTLSAGQYNLGTSPFATGDDGARRTMVGIGAGTSSGFLNSFFGYSAGTNNSGDDNTFSGAFAGQENTSGSSNSFFGSTAGNKNTNGNFNSAFGKDAGFTNTTGDNNSFFGYRAGWSNSTANNNSFFGSDAGTSTTTGVSNSFFGRNAGRDNIVGHSNTFFGASAGVLNTSGADNAFFGRDAGNSNTTGSNNSVFGRGGDVGSGNLTFATAVGANAIVTSSNTIQLGRNGTDVVRIGTLGSSGSTSLCLNGSNVISGCLPSSIRYKSGVSDLTGGLDAVRRLRPVTFSWKSDGTLDIGLIAEEVEQIEPLLTQRKNGLVERVRYNLLGVLLIGAVQEQQKTIEDQGEKLKVQSEELSSLRDEAKSEKEKVRNQEAVIEAQGDRINGLEAELAALKALVCADRPDAAVCK
ncbi:MAG: tail fiber domain-containing protein [Acidobacteriota bacterium]|nr:MAG: tail fiber domain-containing protein [Acidobacteriota bacterium]